MRASDQEEARSQPNVTIAPKWHCVLDCNFFRVTTSAMERVMEQMQFQAIHIGCRTLKNWNPLRERI